LRRQIQGGGATTAGSSRALRLDPFALPVSFTCSDKGADERMRIVELSRERVVMRRAVRGIKMAVKVPVAAYLGLAVRMQAPEADVPGTVSIVLEHHDPALSLPLFSATDGSDIVAEWQSWSRVLGVPLLVAEADGRLREPVQRLGAVVTTAPRRRRRRRFVIARRRPTLPLRRTRGAPSAVQIVHRDEREIIARH
jgi:hypothetical protein